MGTVDLALTGASALLDRMVRLPGIDPMMVAGAKGVLVAFGVAGSAPDSFTSRIEFTGGEHVSINGQQIR